MKNGRTLAILLVALLLTGVGCSPTPKATVEAASRASMPRGFSVMDGMEPLDEGSWRIVTLADGRRRLESRWTTPALFDRVVAWYVEDYGTKGLATHTVEKGDTVKIYWGLAQQINFADQGDGQHILTNKTQVDGKTIVEMHLDLAKQ